MGREEEVSFSRTLVKGIERFKKAAAAAQGGQLNSKDAFELWDSFGFPIDLTQVCTLQPSLHQFRVMPDYYAPCHLRMAFC